MQTLVGIDILMGNILYPRISFYWEQKLAVSQICEHMAVNTIPDRLLSLPLETHLSVDEQMVL